MLLSPEVAIGVTKLRPITIRLEDLLLGVLVLAENVHILMAGAPTSGITEDILETVKSFKEILSVPRIRLQRMGGKYVVKLDI